MRCSAGIASPSYSGDAGLPLWRLAGLLAGGRFKDERILGSDALGVEQQKRQIGARLLVLAFDDFQCAFRK